MQGKRDECVTLHGPEAEQCQKLIEAHKVCLRAEGFKVHHTPPLHNTLMRIPTRMLLPVSKILPREWTRVTVEGRGRPAGLTKSDAHAGLRSRPHQKPHGLRGHVGGEGPEAVAQV